MSKLLDSFWRAALYCLHPRVIALSILPLIIMSAAALALGYFFWDAAMALVRNWLETFGFIKNAVSLLEGWGFAGLRNVLGPLIVLFLAIPVIVMVSLLFVAWLMTPAMVGLVAERRFSGLERKKGGSVASSVFLSLGSTLLALIAMVVSIPLWAIPPLILVLPPLIWGWLTYRVMSYDSLAEHASSDERRELIHQHRAQLLAIGVISGYLGAAPSVLWASGAMFIAMAPILVPVAIWMYTLVFAFSSLWFAHYSLAALAQIRAKKSAIAPVFASDLATNKVAASLPGPNLPGAKYPPAPPAPPALPPVH